MKKALTRPRTTGTVCQIVLDEQKYYFCGDQVRGQLVIIPSKPLKLTGILLEFYGHIKTYINTRKQDGHYFFRELFPLDIPLGTLKPGQTYNYPFEFLLPSDTILPSCTESDANTGGMIEYVIKATTDRPSRDAMMICFHLPVLERVDISKSGMVEPVWDKVTWQSQYPEDIIDKDEYHGVDQVDFAASIPHKGYTRGQEILVTVDIHHFQPYHRSKGLIISLIKNTRVLCKDKAYILSPVVVDSIKIDIDIQHTIGQTITKPLLIPCLISPTITLNSRLMQVDYCIEVRADLGNRQHNDMDLTQMRLEIPVIIGTLPSTLIPPDTLNPKFIKGVKYVGQENLPKQPHPSSSPLFPNFDLASIPSALLEISASNLRGDTFASSRRYSKKQHQPSWSPPGSVHDTNPLSLTTASTSVPSRVTERSSSLLSPTSTIPAYKSDDNDAQQQHKQQQPFYLTLSLGEPFDLLPSSFDDDAKTRTVALDPKSSAVPTPKDDSTTSFSRSSLDHIQPDNLPLTPVPSSPTSRTTVISSSNSIDPHNTVTSIRNNVNLIQSGTPTSSSPVVPPHRTTISSRSSMDLHSDSATHSSPIPPPHSAITSSRSSVDHYQPARSSPLALAPHYSPPSSSRSSMDPIQPDQDDKHGLLILSSPVPQNHSTAISNSMDQTQPDYIVTSNVNTRDDTPSNNDVYELPSNPASRPQSTISSSMNSVDRSQTTPSTEITLPSSPVPQRTSSSDINTMGRPLLVSSVPQNTTSSSRNSIGPSSYQQLSTSQRTTDPGKEHLTESTIDTDEPIHFDKPHEMVDTDSDDDSDDFISILARREKQSVNNDYWQ